jgi:hypothetical protein
MKKPARLKPTIARSSSGFDPIAEVAECHLDTASTMLTG